MYIKVGQHVGAMEYLLPEQYITVFKELHSRAPKSTEEEVRSVIRDELGGEIEGKGIKPFLETKHPKTLKF